jgi:thiol-disulfide isomerase/thioredoxin
MRSLLFAALLCFPLLAVHAAEKKTEKSAKPAAKALPDKPEDFVEEIEALLTEDESDGPASKKEIEAQWKKRIARVDVLIAEFRKKYPDHPRRWDMLFWEANSHDVREEMKYPRPPGSRPSAEVYAEISVAADASPEIRAKASAERVMVLSSEMLEKKLPLTDWEKAAVEHFTKFPEHPNNIMLHDQHARFVRQFDEARLIPLLEEMSKNPQEPIATMAKEKLAGAKEREALKAKPIDLKFKPLDGSEVDLENLRGKVVLVQFWATWCPICMAEMPHVQETYQKLRDKGFEVVGISLDDEEKELRAALKKRPKMTWPQRFDGQGWESPIVKRFGIEQLPTLWLVNKQGMVVDMDASKDLAEKATKLLAE